MIFGVLTEAAVGAVCIILGLLIWKKQKVSLIHDYHYGKVEKEDIPAYARLMGIGIILIGIGIILTGILNLFYSSFWWVPLAAGTVAGLIIMHFAQKKYNGSWFG